MLFSSNKGETQIVSAVSSSTWGIPDQQSISWMVRIEKYIIFMHSLHDMRIKIDYYVLYSISESKYTRSYEITSPFEIAHKKQWRSNNIIMYYHLWIQRLGRISNMNI